MACSRVSISSLLESWNGLHARSDLPGGALRTHREANPAKDNLVAIAVENGGKVLAKSRG
jgi:hypothetical protein